MRGVYQDRGGDAAMKRTPIKRGKPLRRKTPLKAKHGWQEGASNVSGVSPQRNRKPRGGLKRVSDKMRDNLKTYAAAKKEWWSSLPEPKLCQWPGCKKKAEKEPHHKKGRVSSLLWDVRFFAAVCFGHHNEIHENPKHAREIGLLAPASEWNVVPRA